LRAGAWDSGIGRKMLCLRKRLRNRKTLNGVRCFVKD
jgi:hypothetical protein